MKKNSPQSSSVNEVESKNVLSFPIEESSPVASGNPTLDHHEDDLIGQLLGEFDHLIEDGAFEEDIEEDSELDEEEIKAFLGESIGLGFPEKAEDLAAELELAEKSKDELLLGINEQLAELRELSAKMKFFIKDIKSYH